MVEDFNGYSYEFENQYVEIRTNLKNEKADQFFYIIVLKERFKRGKKSMNKT